MKRFVLALLLSVIGCGVDQATPPRICTAAGCVSGLAVTLTNPPAPPYRVDATAGTDIRTQSCPGSGSCAIFFTSFAPARATISVVAASGTATYEVAPQYAPFRPNGADCPPECLQGSAAVSGVIGAVSVYKSAGTVQCSGGGLTPAQMQIQLTGAGIGVISAGCGVDGNAVIAMCGAPDGRINVFEVQAPDVAAAQGLGFDLLSRLPNAARVAC